jgi:glycosyltransferase involved in cell wall biosynthesis
MVNAIGRSEDNRLDVVVVTETYPPEIGGAAMCVARLVDALLRRGHRVRLVRPRQSAADAAGAQAALETLLVPALPVPLHPGLRMGRPAGAVLRRALRARRPDVVHIATEGPLGTSALGVCRVLRIPVSTSFHTNFHHYGSYYGLGGLRTLAVWHLKRFHNNAACTLVPTEQTRAQLRAAGFRDLIVVPRGVDTRLFTPARRSEALRRGWGATPDDLVVVHVGRQAPEKNLALTIRGFRALALARPGTRLVLVGDGPQRSALERQHPDVIFAGVRRGEDLAAHYASADVFLFPSLTETFGNVTLEAMASGLAVVAFDDAAAHEHVRHGASGLLVPRGDAGAFVDAGLRLARDPALLARLRAQAVHDVAALSWDSVGARFERVLQNVARSA